MEIKVCRKKELYERQVFLAFCGAETWYALCLSFEAGREVERGRERGTARIISRKLSPLILRLRKKSLPDDYIYPLVWVYQRMIGAIPRIREMTNLTYFLLAPSVNYCWRHPRWFSRTERNWFSPVFPPKDVPLWLGLSERDTKTNCARPGFIATSLFLSRISSLRRKKKLLIPLIPNATYEWFLSLGPDGTVGFPVVQLGTWRCYWNRFSTCFIGWRACLLNQANE